MTYPRIFVRLVTTAVLALTAQAASAASPFTDEQTLQLLETAAEANVQLAEEAISTSHQLRVKSYGDDLLAASARLGQRLRRAAAELHLTPAPSSLEASLKARSTADLAELRVVYGAAFDDEFLRGQIDRQGDLLALIDDLLLPQVSAPELKAVVEAARLDTARQLLFAKQIRGDRGR